VLRGFVVLPLSGPLFAHKGQHYVFYLSCTHRERWVSLTYHVNPLIMITIKSYFIFNLYFRWQWRRSIIPS
jgi:hypothetical protein